MVKQFFLVISLVVLHTVLMPVKAQDSLSFTCNLSKASENIEIKYRTAEWFGKRKFTIPDFAEGYNKTGVTAVDQKGGGEYNEFRTVYPFSVFIKDKTNSEVTAKGKAVILESTIIKQNSFFEREITGIESETWNEQSYSKTLNAKIHDQSNPSMVWDLHFVKIREALASRIDSLSRLTYNDRAIAIRMHNIDIKTDVSEPIIDQSIVFVENNNCLAEEYQGKIWFQVDVDHSLRRILTAAIIAIGN